MKRSLSCQGDEALVVGCYRLADVIMKPSPENVLPAVRYYESIQPPLQRDSRAPASKVFIY